ncbi:MAG: hypothetical protein H7A32_04120 [Deltaproteobacteria bacterium]|nr:hypothetical protein [Deltaproteobacteria bacterium]
MRKNFIIKKVIFLTLLFCGLSSQAFAEMENIEYGRVSELLNRPNVYVYSLDFETREDIVKEVEKTGDFRVVGRPEDAQFFIHYGTSLQEIGHYYTYNLFWRDRHSIKKSVGEMYVYSHGDRVGKGRRIRVYFGRSFDPKQQYTKAPIIGIPIALKHPAAQRARDFMKKVRKAKKDLQTSHAKK